MFFFNVKKYPHSQAPARTPMNQRHYNLGLSRGEHEGMPEHAVIPPYKATHANTSGCRRGVQIHGRGSETATPNQLTTQAHTAYPLPEDHGLSQPTSP